jgi:hypothetical protein
MIATSFHKEIQAGVAIGFCGEDAREFAENIRGELARLLDIEAPPPRPETEPASGGVRIAITLSPAMAKLWRAVFISINRSLSRLPLRAKAGWIDLRDGEGRPLSRHAFREASDLDAISRKIEAQVGLRRPVPR